MIIDIEDELKEEIQFFIRCLIFDGGTGIKISKLRALYEDNYSIIYEKSKKIFEFLGVELRNNEFDDTLFLVPFKDFYTKLEDYDLLKMFQVLSQKQREILTRIISLLISEGKEEPISKEKIKLELNNSFGIIYTERELKELNKLGYIKLIRNKFVDVGWRLRNSPEIKKFSEYFISNIEEIEENLKEK